MGLHMLNNTRQSLGSNEEVQYKILKYYETAKFGGDQSELIGKLK